MPRGLSLYQDARAQGQLWTPAEFRPSMWFDAFDLRDIINATGVSSWANRGTLGGAATQATAANQPAYRNGDGDANRRAYPYLDFDGANDALSISAGLGSAAEPNMYLFAVARPGGAGNTYKTTVFGNIDGSLWVLRDVGTASASQWRFVGSGSVQDTTFNNGAQIGSVTLTATTPGARQASTDEWAVYSRQLLQASGTGAINFSSNPAYIARGDGSSGLTTSYTKIAECLAIPSLIGANGRQKVEGYLAWKWGLPLVAAHPYANRPPMKGP